MGGKIFRRIARAAAQIRNDRIRRDQTQHRLKGELLTEQILSKLIPFAAHTTEKGLAVHPALGEHFGESGVILLQGGSRSQLMLG